MLPVGGGRDYPRVGIGQIEFISKVADQTGLGDLEPKKLFHRYGTRALEVAQYLRAGRDAPLTSRPDWSRREVEFLVEREKAVHVDDILMRRSSLTRQGEVTQALVVELSQIMGDFRGWTDEQKEGEVQRVFPESIPGR
jgi:glycerol-3-phosphate dehydrogenase